MCTLTGLASEVSSRLKLTAIVEIFNGSAMVALMVVDVCLSFETVIVVRSLRVIVTSAVRVVHCNDRLTVLRVVMFWAEALEGVKVLVHYVRFYELLICSECISRPITGIVTVIASMVA